MNLAKKIVLLSTLAILGACGNKPNEDFLGTWQNVSQKQRVIKIVAKDSGYLVYESGIPSGFGSGTHENVHQAIELDSRTLQADKNPSYTLRLSEDKKTLTLSPLIFTKVN